MKCKSCGAELSENSKFCGMCGEPNTAFPDPTKAKEDDVDSILNDIYDKQKQKQDNASSGLEEQTEAAAEKNQAFPSPVGFIPSDTADSSQEKKALSGEGNTENIQNSPTEQRIAAPQNGQASARQGGYAENGSYGYNAPYGAYPQSPAPSPAQAQGVPQGNSASGGSSNYPPKPEPVQKEKKVMPFGVGVFCIIAVFVLSAFCGYLIELCLGSGINPFNPAKAQSTVQLYNNDFYGEDNG